MRRLSPPLMFVLFGLLYVGSAAQAIPVTSGTGPGGVGTTNGASTLEVWYQANTIGQSNGSTVTAWTDGSGNLNHAGTTGSNPSFVTPALNGQPSVQFTGTQALSLPGLTALPNFTILSVAQSTGDRYLLGHNTLNRQIRARQGGGGIFSAFNGVENPQSSAYTTTAANYFISGWLADSASDTMAFFERGASRGSGGLVNGLDTLNRLGQDNGTGSTIRVAEISIFTERLGEARRLLIENAFSAKYDVSMLANDLYAGDDGGNGNYDSNVFGIGRSADLDELTSSGQAGFGIEAAGTLDAGEFVMAGHNVATNSLVPEGDGQRWDRVWYLDETPDDGIAALLSFDFTDSGLAAPVLGPLETVVLLYSADEPFDFAPVNAGLTIDGDTYTFLVSDAALLDGYYTLAIITVPEPSTGLLLGLGGLGLAWSTRRRR